ncbi:MAG: hypothetical protein ACXW4E_00190 [Anaerolineales bacterium]
MKTESTEVQINNLSSTMRVMDGDSLLAPQTLEKIVRAVLHAVNEQEEHHKRVREERRITRGVMDEMDQEDR